MAAFIFSSLFLEKPLAFWLPASILSLFSLLGDRVEISPKLRLPVQFINKGYSILCSNVHYFLKLIHRYSMV
jgi:hypothetical protein